MFLIANVFSFFKQKNRSFLLKKNQIISKKISLNMNAKSQKKIEKTLGGGGGLARYRKPQSIKEFEDAYFNFVKATHPNFPYPVRHTFRDDTSNELTKIILRWLTVNGYFGGRVNTTGIYNEKLKKYTYGGGRRGMADITAVIDGRHVSIEIKTGRDKMREAQIKVKNEIERAGGTYIVVRSFDDFLRQIAVLPKMENISKQ